MRAPATKITGLYAGLFVAGPGFLLERDFRKRPRPQLFGIGHRIATAISLIAIATAGRVPPGRNGTRSGGDICFGMLLGNALHNRGNLLVFWALRPVDRALFANIG